MTHMRTHALSEPLVDAVDSRQITTNHTILIVSLLCFFTEYLDLGVVYWNIIFDLYDYLIVVVFVLFFL